MKIAYLTNQYPSPSHSFIRREIRALESAGISVERFSTRHPRAALVDRADLQEQALTHVLFSAEPQTVRGLMTGVTSCRPATLAVATKLARSLGRRSHSGTLRHLGYLLQACALRAACRELECTHVHAHFGSNPAAVALLCHALGGPPFSFTVHGPDELENPPAYHLAEKMRAARFVVAITEHCRRALTDLAPELSDRIHVVRCGLDPSWLELEPTPPPRAPRIVAVGRLVQRKRHEDLIRAVHQLSSEGQPAELRIIGDGERFEALQGLIAELGVSNRVQLLGWQSEAQVLAAIRESRVLALPSTAEGLPSVLFEAFALGRPVVASRVAGIPELVEHGRSGWLMRPGSVSDLNAALREALRASPSELLRMGRIGRERVRACHDLRTSARRLAELMSADTAGDDREKDSAAMGRVVADETARQAQGLPPAVSSPGG